ncbi:O-antigen ligase family protein [Frigidibacter sp. RF13]|uniref:O-antigen ligase family protein n=1 Tax=Frigidibacter sp. RF13 TaxID=2997340 RepID=UPI00226E0A00|nr:O-antigen ligase family protein [Frigidibacter sp. RF13]MCY1126030.1 O-antigen ligase family protein [Frigidibacter sp. RF13]
MADTGITSAPVPGGQAMAKPAVGLVLCYMLLLLLPIKFSIGTVALSPLRVYLLFVVPVLLVNLFSGKYGRVNAADVLMTLHILWAIVAIAVNNPNRVVENVGSTAVEFLGGYLVARASIRDPQSFKIACTYIFLSVLILIPFGVSELFSGKPVIAEAISRIPGLSSVPDVSNAKRLGLERVQNIFEHPIHYGLYSSTAFALTFYVVASNLGIITRLLFCGLVFAAVMLSLSSGAVLAVLAQCALIGWALVFRNVPKRWILLISSFVLAYVAVDLLSNRTPMKVFMSYATFDAQTAYYRSIINEWGMYNVWNNPIFGLGLRSWIRPGYMLRGSVDNFWLVNAMKYGIPGFLLLAAGYAYALIAISLKNLDADKVASVFRFAWVVTMCGLTFTLITVHVWATIYSYTIFLLGAGIWVIDYRPTIASVPESAPQGRSALTYARPRSAETSYSRRPAPGDEPDRGNRQSARRSRGAEGTQQVFTRFPGPHQTPGNE